MFPHHRLLPRLLFENATKGIDIFRRDRLKNDLALILYEIDARSRLDPVPAADS